MQRVPLWGSSDRPSTIAGKTLTIMLWHNQTSHLPFNSTSVHNSHVQKESDPISERPCLASHLTVTGPREEPLREKQHCIQQQGYTVTRSFLSGMCQPAAAKEDNRGHTSETIPTGLPPEGPPTKPHRQ